MTEVAQGLSEAAMLLDVRRFDEATSLLARIVAAEPDNGQAWCLLTSAHLGAGRYPETVAAAGRARTLSPADDWPYRLASVAQRHLGKTAEALAEANQACRLAPGEWRAYICLAQAQLAEGVDFIAAQRSAGFALRLAPNEPDAHFTAGQVCYCREQWGSAREHQEKALALDPAHSGALNELGRISLRLGGDARAAQHFLQAARSDPGVRTFGNNAEVPAQYVLYRMVGAVFLATFALAYVTLLDTRIPRPAVAAAYALAVGASAWYGSAQLRGLPPEMRLLLRTRRVALAFGVLYSAAVVDLVTAAAAPSHALAIAMPLASLLMLGAAFTAATALRRKPPAPGRARPA